MDNPAAPIPSIAPQPTVPSPAKTADHRWLLWLAGGIFLLGFGIALGIFSAKFLNQSQNQSKLTPTSTPTQSPSPIPFPDPTVGWETYISPNNYSIRYPKNWTITSSEAAEWQQEVGTPNFSVVSNKYKIIFSFPSGFGPGICIFSDQPDFTKSFPDNPIAEESKCPGEFIEVKGEAFVFRRLSKPTPPPREGYSQEWSVYTKDNNGNFVTVPPINYDVPPKYDLIIIKEMDQILSTFKFLDQSNEICNIDQEYQNTAVNPVTCQCPDGYEWKILRTSFGPCPAGQARDCPQTLQKCSPQNR